MGDLKFSPSAENQLGSQIFRGTYIGKPVAVKKFKCDETDHRNDEDWEKLIKLCDDNIVQYLHTYIEAGTRLLVMDICQGSMLDYCCDKLHQNVRNHIKVIDIMWQMTCGLEYLHHQKITHGNLVLKNVLFWTKDSKSKRIVVKLTGYHYKQHYSKMDFKNDVRNLGRLFYAAGSKLTEERNETISQHCLTELNDNHRVLGLELINLIVNEDSKKKKVAIEVATLLRHPFFTQHVEEARTKLKESLCNITNTAWKKDKLQKWKESVDESKFNDEEFGDLEEIVGFISEKSNIPKRVDEAFKTTPKYFSEYIWHLTIEAITSNNAATIIKKDELGKGSYGKVYKCLYTDEEGNEIMAACKKSNHKKRAEEIFNKEMQTLKQLNHLFVIRYIDDVEENSKKYIVMELCEGTLKQYFNGELGRIPKDTLDDKIIVSQVTLGLAYIHDQNIIHKDLKPDNILLWCHPTKQELVLAKIADFGFAKELKPNQAEFSNTEHPGTEGYMAPELLNAADGNYPASFASDVYSLGITIGLIVLKGTHPVITSGKEMKNILVMTGVIPQNIQTLSWELQDLILKLTDNDPGKRPTMSLVLRHPYFVMTNERTKWQFVDDLHTYFSLLKLKKKDSFNEIFNSRNFEKWYNTDYRTPTNNEDAKKMTEVKQFLRNISWNDNLYSKEDYERTKKEAIKPEYNMNVGRKINQVLFEQMSYDGASSSYRLYKLIEHAPKLLTLYIWSQLVSVVDIQSQEHLEIKPPLKSGKRQMAASRQSDENNLPITSKNLLKNPFPNMILELAWSSFFYDKEELIDELWKIKYGSKPNGKDQETDPDVFSTTLAKCNVSEQIWFDFMIQLEDVTPLLFASVQSHYSIAPKMTEMILKTRGWPSWMVENKEKMLTPMHIAAFNRGKYGADIIQVLLKNGGNPNTADHNGVTPVHYASRNESNSACKIMKHLLETGGDPNVYFGNDGFMPIHLAARNEGDYSHEIMKELLKHGSIYDKPVNINIPEIWVKPIHFAASNKGTAAPKLLKLLIEKHQNADVISGLRGWTPLHHAVFKSGDNGREILETLFENGADPNARDDYGRTPLHWAVHFDKDRTIEIMEIILKNGGNPNAIDNNGETPVHVAVYNEGEQAPGKLQLLLDKGGDPTLKDNNNLTAIHFSLLNTGDYGNEIRKKLPINKENVNEPGNIHGDTLLHHVTDNLDQSKSLEQARILLENNANPNITNKLGLSPVHVAAGSDSRVSPSLLQLLLEKRGNPNLPENKLGQTPVHLVSSNKGVHAPEMMRLLLDSGGNLCAQDKEKSTPLHLAAQFPGIKGPGLIRIIIEHGGDPNVCDIYQRTALHLALRNENDEKRFEIVTELLKGGGNPNAKDANGETPVHYVVTEKRNNSLELIKLLLEKGGCVNVPRNDNLTPLNLVFQTGRKKCCSDQVRRYVQKQSMKKK